MKNIDRLLIAILALGIWALVVATMHTPATVNASSPQFDVYGTHHNIPLYINITNWDEAPR